MEVAVFAAGLFIFLAHLLDYFFERTRVPDILLLMLLGVIVGPIAGLMQPSDFGFVGEFLSVVTLVVILCASGLGLKFDVLLKAAPRATPKAFPKAAPASAKEPWTSFKRRLDWKRYGGNGGPQVAGVKQFLIKAGKPFTNSRKTSSSWKDQLLKGRLRGKFIYDVDRNFFNATGIRPGGGSPMPVATEEALAMVYETYFI